MDLPLISIHMSKHKVLKTSYEDLFAFLSVLYSFIKPTILTYCFALQHKKRCIIKLMAIVYCLLCENPSPQITFE